MALPASDDIRSYLPYALIPLAIGFVLIPLMIAIDSVQRVADPDPSSAPLAEYAQRPEFFVHVGLEIGVAFLIAGIVALFIDAAARRSQTRLLQEGINLIGNDVFQGVYRIYHEPAYVKAVVGTCLAIRHIRKEYEVDCVVSEFTQDERRRWGIESESLIKVDAEVTYFSENIADRDSEFPGRYFIPRGFGKAGNIARLTYLEVGERKYETEAQIEALELPATHRDHSDSERGYRFPIPAKARTPTKVHLRATFAKERSDNEIFTFLKPTIGAKIKFRFNIPGLTVGVTARTATVMTPGPEILPGRSVSWEVRGGALLPNNHVTVWWQTDQASGASTDSSGLTALENATVGQIDAELEPAQPVAPQEAPPSSRLRMTIKSVRGALARLTGSSGDSPT